MTKTGKSRDHYEFLSLLGDGAISRVYLARDRVTNEEVAIKIIPKSRISNNFIRQRIISERAILTQMNHRSIIKLLFAFQDKYSLYFVLELGGKVNLNEYLIRMGNQLPFELAKFYTAEIIAILVYLRSKSVAHRDLKPENFLVDDFGHLKLIDFNASCFVVESSQSESTNNPIDSPLNDSDTADRSSESTIVKESSSPQGFDSQQLVGTCAYLPPESLSMNLKNDFSADLWAFGCIAFQLFVGSPPFPASSRSSLKERIQQVEFSYPESVPDIVKDFINRLLMKEPEDRLGARDITEIYNHPLFNGMDVRNSYLNSPPMSPRTINPDSQDDEAKSALTSNDLDALELTPNIGETFSSLKPVFSLS